MQLGKRVQLDLPDGDLWVFGYGSLMWNPGFAHKEVTKARLHGYHRALCVWSWFHRGSRMVPGLVLGLDRGGACVGRLYRIEEEDKQRTVEYLHEREMVTSVYFPVLRSIHTADRQRVEALTYIVDRSHVQYAGRLSAEQAAVSVRRARGRSGANTDYVINTVNHLCELGVSAGVLHRVGELLNDG
jgi:cation transport protein ChaC